MATAYWEGPGAAKTFTHPVPHRVIAQHVEPTARVLDFGCGYGRVMRELTDAGYRELVGVDPSAALISRGRSISPDLDLRHAPGLPLPFPDGSFDAVLLVAVLAVITDEKVQRATADEVQRLCAPGGTVLLCDFPLQDDDRHAALYAASAHALHGVFTTPDGGEFRHHPADHLRALFPGCALVHSDEVTMTSLHDHSIRGLQWVLKKDDGAHAPMTTASTI